jgi:hypothetical protein
MKFLHKLLVFALLFVGVITQASAESFTVNGVCVSEYKQCSLNIDIL